jgi:hypothetical protein
MEFGRVGGGGKCVVGSDSKFIDRKAKLLCM